MTSLSTSDPTSAPGQTVRLSHSVDGGRPASPPVKPRDWQRLALIAGLALLSWISTYSGMLELVEANLGALDITLKVAIGLSVAMLMLMVVWLLDQIFSPIGFVTRSLFVAGYLFLTLISIGFSFGFYWKFLESRTEASRSAESAVTQVQSSLQGAETRLAQLLTTLDVLTTVSTQKAADEVAKGNSCPNSRPGDGPRRRLREADATRFGFASQFVQSRIAALKTEVKGLEGELAKVVKQDKSTFDKATGTRNEFMRGLGRRLDRAVTGFNAFRTDPQLQQFRGDFAARAEQTAFSDEQGGKFVCPDVQLQTALRGVVKAIDQLPELERPAIATVEGAEATVEAFRRLLVTLSGLVRLELPPSADDIRALQQKAIQSLSAPAATPSGDVAVGLGKRDWIPLMIAVFVDFCLLLVSIKWQRTVRSATGQYFRTLDDLRAIHDDPVTLARLEPLRHISFDFGGHDYVAVPLIVGFDRTSPGLARFTEDDLKEAQFLSSFFASHEKDGLYRRSGPWPTQEAVRRKLSTIRSKWAAIPTFRVYRFKLGTWSDFVLDTIVGARSELQPVREAQREIRVIEIDNKRDTLILDAKSKRQEQIEQIEDREHAATIRRRQREREQQLELEERENAHRLRALDVMKQRREVEREQSRLDNPEPAFEDMVPGEEREGGFGLNWFRKRIRRLPSRQAATLDPLLATASLNAAELATIKASVSELAMELRSRSAEATSRLDRQTERIEAMMKPLVQAAADGRLAGEPVAANENAGATGRAPEAERFGPTAFPSASAPRFTRQRFDASAAPEPRVIELPVAAPARASMGALAEAISEALVGSRPKAAPLRPHVDAPLRSRLASSDGMIMPVLGPEHRRTPDIDPSWDASPSTAATEIEAVDLASSSPADIDRFIASVRRRQAETPFGDAPVDDDLESASAPAIAEDEPAAWGDAGHDWELRQSDALGGIEPLGEDTEIDHESITQWYRRKDRT